MRSTFVLRPPQSPLSVVTTIAPTRFTGSRGTRNGCLYSVFALAMCIAMLNVFSTYGRVARIRSCAFFIFDAATSSIALVILRVFCTLLILFRISFEPAMGGFLLLLKGACLLEVLDCRGERLFVIAGHVLGLLELVHDRRVFALHEL